MSTRRAAWHRVLVLFRAEGFRIMRLNLSSQGFALRAGASRVAPRSFLDRSTETERNEGIVKKSEFLRGFGSSEGSEVQGVGV